MKYFLVLIGISLLQNYQVNCQSIHLTIKNGLKSDSYNSFVTEDNFGGYYIAGINQLLYFDGHKIDNILIGEEYIFQSDPIVFEGNIWITTYSELLSINIISREVRRIQVQDKDSNYLESEYHLFYLDEINRLVYFRAGNSIYNLDLDNPQVYKKLGPTKSKRFIVDQVLSTCTDYIKIYGFPWMMGSGFEYYEFCNGALRDYDYQDLTFLDKSESLSFEISSGIIEDSILFLVSKNGLIEYNLNRIDSSTFFEYNMGSLFDIFLFDSEYYLSTSDRGIVKFDREISRYVLDEDVISINRALPSLNIQEAYLSKCNVLFTSIDNGGVVLQYLSGLNYIINCPKCNVISIDLESNIWTASESIVKVFSKNGDLIDSINLKLNDAIRKIMHINNDNAFIFLNYSVYSYNKNLKLLRKEIDIPHGRFYDSLIEKGRVVSIITSSGRYKVIYGNVVPEFQKESDDNEECLKYLYNSNGVSMISISPGEVKIFTPHFDTSLIFDKEITSVIKDEIDNSYIFNSSESIYIVDEKFGVSRLFVDQLYLTNTHINKVYRTLNYYYVFTSKNIVKYNISSEEYLLRESFQYYNYSEVDGIVLGVDGDIYLNDLGLLSKFDTSDNDFNMIEPFLNIESISKGGVALDGLNLSSDLIELNFKLSKDDLVIEANCIDVLLGDESFVEYKIVNKEDLWHIKTGSEEIRFDNLEPSDYEILLVPVSSSGIKGNPSTLLITISPPYYQTWWFRSVSILSLIGLGFGVNYIITNRKLKAAQIQLDKQAALSAQREKIADDLHDELGTELSKILYLSDEAIETKDQNKKEDLVQEITKLASASIVNMRDMLWVLEQKNDTLDSLLARIRSSVRKTLEEYDIVVDFKYTDESYMHVNMTGEVRQQILLIIKEIIHNIIKHAKASQVDIVAQVVDGKLVLEIKDDGIGYELGGLKIDNLGDQEYMPSSKGRGLSSMTRRAKSIGAELRFDSEVGKGARVLLELTL